MDHLPGAFGRPDKVKKAAVKSSTSSARAHHEELALATGKSVDEVAGLQQVVRPSSRSRTSSRLAHSRERAPKRRSAAKQTRAELGRGRQAQPRQQMCCRCTLDGLTYREIARCSK